MQVLIVCLSQLCLVVSKANKMFQRVGMNNAQFEWHIDIKLYETTQLYDRCYNVQNPTLLMLAYL